MAAAAVFWLSGGRLRWAGGLYRRATSCAGVGSAPVERATRVIGIPPQPRIPNIFLEERNGDGRCAATGTPKGGQRG